MSIFIKKPLAKRNWSKFMEHIGLAALEGLSLNIPNAIREIDSSVTTTFKEHRPDEVAWTWMYASLAAAFYNFYLSVPESKRIKETEYRKKSKKFAENILDKIEGGELHPKDLINPAEAEALNTAKDIISKALNEISSDEENSDININKFRIAFRSASARVLSLDHTYYAPLNDILNNPMSEGEQRDRSWQRHAAWIRGLYERKPIFSIDPNKVIPLKDVYQPLRGYWHDELKKDDLNPENNIHRFEIKEKKYVNVNIDHLHNIMHDWLRKPLATPLRIIAGGPGSGKSSFSKSFSVEVIDKTDWRVIFVELQNLEFDKGDLERRIGEYLTSAAVYSAIGSSGTAGFPQNPLSWRTDSSEPILLVFDGLDELSASDETSSELSRAFVLGVNNYLVRANGNSLIAPIRAIILGRNAACEAGIRAANLSLTSVVHVAALKPLKDENDFGVRDRTIEKVIDPCRVCKIDQRIEYWNRWAALNKIEFSKIPTAVTSDILEELNVEPLLLHLLIQSGYTGDNWKKAANNRNRVYHEIFHRVLTRNAAKLRLSSNVLAPADAMIALECMGLAAWRGGGRTGGNDAFRDLLERFAPRLHNNHRDDNELLSQNYVAVQFHTRQGFGDGYEFLHKSFGEYLTARALLSIAQVTARRMRDEEPESLKESARRWCTLIASAEMTEFVLRFVFDEARLLAEEKNILPIKDALMQLFSWVQNNGMPVHEGASGSYREIETAQRCAETALLTVLSALARACRNMECTGSALHETPPWSIKVNWPENSVDHSIFPFVGLVAPRKMIGRLGDSWQPVFRKMLGGLIMSECWLSNSWLLDADLSRTNLVDSHLVLSNLARADFTYSDLTRASLQSAYASQADFSGAILVEADFKEADLSSALLVNADLSKSDFSYANLHEADLNDARLNSADLTRANLTRADLSNADLTDADFANTDLTDAKLYGANLTSAKNLSQEQINSATGSKSKTQLPIGLIFPTSWNE